MRQKSKPLLAAAVLVVAGSIIYSYWFTARPARIKLGVPQEARISQEIEVPLTISVPKAANAAEFYFSFPINLLEAITVKQSDSVFALWITDPPVIDNEKGIITIAGGTPTPGFQGQNLLIGTIIFRVKSAGVAKINLEEKRSRILANDGLGTAIGYRWQPIEIKIKN